MAKSSPDFSLHTGAKGGGQLGRNRDFMKEEDEFRAKDHGKRDNADVVGVLSDKDQAYAKGDGSSLAKRSGDKCLPTVKPRG